MNQPKPALNRRHLTQRLLELRKGKGMTQQDVAGELEWSQSKVQRIEAGLSAISWTDLSVLLSLYGAEPSERETLRVIAREARTRSELTSYRDVAGRDYLTYLRYEEIATRLLQYEASLVPGILQTPGYAQTSLRAFAAFDEPGDQDLGARIKRKSELRGARQRRLVEGELAADFLLNESVLRHAVGAETGEPGVMVEQLEHLRELDALPNVNLAVLPFAMGAHLGMLGAFAVLELPDDAERPLLYSENALGDIATKERPEQAKAHRRAFEDLWSKALRGPSFAAAIEEAIEHLR